MYFDLESDKTLDRMDELQCMVCGARNGRRVIKAYTYTKDGINCADWVTVCSECGHDERMTHKAMLMDGIGTILGNSVAIIKDKNYVPCAD